MGVSGPVYSPVRLPPANDPSVTNEKESGWASDPIWTLLETEKSLPLSEIKP